MQIPLWLSEWGPDWPIDMLRAGPIRCKWYRADIATRACQKDGDAFTQLYGYYRRPIGKRLMALVNNVETARDLYQDTFLRAWQYATPTIADGFEPWLYRVARNLAVDHIRHAGKFTFVPLPSEELSQDEPYPDKSREHLFEALSWNWSEDQIIELLMLEEIIAAMSPQYRACLLLQWHWGLKQREIAERLDITERTVSSNVSQAYKQFAKLYIAKHGSSRGERSGGGGRRGLGKPTGDQPPVQRPRTTPGPVIPHEPSVIPVALPPRLQQLWQPGRP